MADTAAVETAAWGQEVMEEQNYKCTELIKDCLSVKSFLTSVKPVKRMKSHYKGQEINWGL